MSALRPAERLAQWACELVGTPFQFESKLPVLPKGALRVNMADFDCVTLIYVAVALSLSTGFDDFIRQLALLRHDIPDAGTPLDDSAADGNFLDFVEESLLERALEWGWLFDVTERVAQKQSLMRLTVELKPIRRPAAFDDSECCVGPRRGNRWITHAFIPSAALSELDVAVFQDGDLIVFGKDPEKAEGDLRHILVRHLAIVRKVDSQLLFIHSSRNFAWRPDATRETPPSHTGIFYDDRRRCEQLGVDYCGAYAGDEFILKTESDTYFAMDMDRKRALHEYASANFTGIKVMRLA
jgi:hypothetical protein